MVHVPRLVLVLFGLSFVPFVCAVFTLKEENEVRHGSLAPKWRRSLSSDAIGDEDASLLESRAITAGKMRYVNNSGVCGTFLFFIPFDIHAQYAQFRDDSRRLSGFWIC